jgi:hypothetical protein
MFEACVQVILRSETHHVLEMTVIDVGIHSEKPLENNLDDRCEVLGECYAYINPDYYIILRSVYRSASGIGLRYSAESPPM